MGNVVSFPTAATILDLPPDRVMSDAADAELTELVVVGYGPDGLFIGATAGDARETLWLLERARHKIMMAADQAEAP